MIKQGRNATCICFRPGWNFSTHSRAHVFFSQRSGRTAGAFWIWTCEALTGPTLSRTSWNLISVTSWKLTAHTLWTTWEIMRIYPNSWLLNHIFVMKGNKIISSHIDIVVIGPAKSATNEAVSVKCRLIKPWDSYGSNWYVNMLALGRQGFHSDLRCHHADWDQLPAVAKEGRQFASKLFLFGSTYQGMQEVSFQIHFKNRFVKSI